jgi:hypothetical protein
MKSSLLRVLAPIGCLILEATPFVRKVSTLPIEPLLLTTSTRGLWLAVGMEGHECRDADSLHMNVFGFTYSKWVLSAHVGTNDYCWNTIFSILGLQAPNSADC